MSFEADLAQMREGIVTWRDICAKERETGARFVTTENVEALLTVISAMLDESEKTLQALQRVVDDAKVREWKVQAEIESAIEEAAMSGYQLGVQAAMANPTAAALGVLVNEELRRRA